MKTKLKSEIVQNIYELVCNLLSAFWQQKYIIIVIHYNSIKSSSKVKHAKDVRYESPYLYHVK